ncbi:DUF3693 domain-containing protein [Salinivibrio sp. IB872]|uniref:DUF3693 domain-containing protein n=1 Tax=Salinivibrio sp. IB872 TaxID=1766123 RepID=UPI0009841930|nr:DUF3693 domain-containing protein [Salinivibrio sp. IB872]OOF24419.1 hypothetical protein BZJ18_13320 [Salinivibrio sp. IB872]
MFHSELLDAYKKAKNYVQDKQIAHDLEIPPSRISEMRKGKHYLSESAAIFLAQEAGLDIHEVLIKIAADRAKNTQTKKAWETILGKLHSQGLHCIQGLSLGLMGLMLTAEYWSQCALSILC